MRGLGLFFGHKSRNDPVKLNDPRPIPRYEDPQHSGNAALDGYSLLSRADPDRQGSPPQVAGQEGTMNLGPAEDFEQ